MISYRPETWDRITRILSHVDGDVYLSRSFGVDVFYAFGKDMRRCVTYVTPSEGWETVIVARVVGLAPGATYVDAVSVREIPRILPAGDPAASRVHLTSLDVEAINVLTELDPTMDREVTLYEFADGSNSVSSGSVSLVRRP